MECSFTCECGNRVLVSDAVTRARCPACDRRYEVRFTVETRPMRACANPRCSEWVVQDDPRRRYCTDACQNRARQRRFQQRRRASA